MIVLKSPEEIEVMQEANQIVADILQTLKEKSKPGVTTQDLDRVAEEMALKRNATCAFKGYRGYPWALCASRNEVIVHGMPSSEELREGDILSLDFGVFHKGFYGDSAVTFPIGNVDEDAEHLIRTTKECLDRAIEQMHEGKRLSDVSSAIQTHAESRGFSVVRDFVGHGIGRQLHEDPQVPNYGKPGTGIRLKKGMVLAVEPMVNVGDWRISIMKDGWTAVTKDRKLSAHFEHSIAITENGPLILSAPS
jgi:methionyl aminopeptidase